MGNICKKQTQTQRHPARLAQTHLLPLFPAHCDKSWAILRINAKLQVPKDAHPSAEDAAVPQAGSVLQGEVGAAVAQDSSGSRLNPSQQLSTRETLHRAPIQPPNPVGGKLTPPQPKQPPWGWAAGASLQAGLKTTPGTLHPNRIHWHLPQQLLLLLLHRKGFLKPLKLPPGSFPMPECVQMLPNFQGQQPVLPNLCALPHPRLNNLVTDYSCINILK